jgi:hypothetical protein
MRSTGSAEIDQKFITFCFRCVAGRLILHQFSCNDWTFSQHFLIRIGMHHAAGLPLGSACGVRWEDGAGTA